MSSDQITLLLSLIAGFLGVPIIQWAKTTFKLADKQALTAAGIVSILLALVVLAGQGVFSGLAWPDITISFVVETMTVTFTTATLIYKYFVSQKPE